MLTDDIIATREKTLAAHLDGETRKDVEAVVETTFPDGFDGQQQGQEIRVHTVGIFPFDGDRLLVEKLYADMSPLLPYLDFLE